MLPITRDELKDLLMIPADDTAQDARLDSHLTRAQPAVEYMISEEALQDTGNSGLQALLRLGVMEVLAGEFSEQMASEEGATEAFKVASIQIGERRPDPAGLKARGWERLRPFLKAQQELWSSTLGQERDFEREQGEEEQVRRIP